MSRKPNILWICTDQQRADTLGCYGSPYVDTPNLDRLAANGVLFEQAFCQSPVCTPSRASFMTGRYPRTTRCRANGQIIPREERFISRILADNGYYCGLSGKLHTAPANPEICPITEIRIDDGFHEFHWSHHPAGIGVDGNPDAGGCNWLGNEYSRWLFDRGVTFRRTNVDPKGLVQYSVPEEYHQTTWCFEKAINWIDYATAYDKTQPWFYLINTFDPHHAFDPPKELLDKYMACMDQFPMPNYTQGELEDKTRFQKNDHHAAYNTPGWYDFDKMTPEEHRLVRAAYYAEIELIDRSVGRIMRCLKKNGLLEDTIIVFTSDHGEMLGDHGIYLKGPYFYDCMTHVPFLMSWKGHIAPGQRRSALVELSDIVPTLLDYCDIPRELGMQGRSMRDLINDSSVPFRGSVYCEYYEAMPYHNDPNAMATMVYDGRFKCCRYHSSDEGELYDLHTDPNETHNLWDDPDSLGQKCRMLQLMTDRMCDTVDPLPPLLARW